MSRLQSHCPICGKILKIKRFIDVGNKRFHKAECGHTIVTPQLLESIQDKVPDRLDFHFGKDDELQLLPFQKDNILAAERANFKCLFADDPGLGKTFQFLGCLRLHPDDLLPALVVCKAGLRTQIAKECFRMTGYPAQIMEANYSKPQFYKKAIVIVSYPMIWRMKWPNDYWTKFKTVIVDECQALKDQTSKQTIACRRVMKEATHVMGASATPLMNNGKEYFPILNAIAPDRFHSEAAYVTRWLTMKTVRSATGRETVKIGGIKPWLLDDWKNFTKDIIFRHKKEDVLPDLPPIRREYRDCDLAEEVKDAYDEEMKKFIEEYSEKMSFSMYSNLLARIARMRHLVALSKIQDTIEEIDEVLIGSNEKVVVFVHHIKAGEIVFRKIMKHCEEGGFAEPLWLRGGIPNEERDAIVDAFVNGPSRVLVASALASGEGLDGLQKVCGLAIMHERMWNATRETQIEGRFSRIGSTKSSVLVKYMIAIGTIDEWITDLVDNKRKITTSVIEGREVTDEEVNLTREMMDIIFRKGRERWRLA